MKKSIGIIVSSFFLVSNVFSMEGNWHYWQGNGGNFQVPSYDSNRRPLSLSPQDIGYSLFKSLVTYEVISHFWVWLGCKLYNHKMDTIKNRWKLFGDSPEGLSFNEFHNVKTDFEASHNKTISHMVHEDLNYIYYLLYRIRGREITSFYQFLEDLYIDDNCRIRFLYKTRYLYSYFLEGVIERTINELESMSIRLQIIQTRSVQR